MVEILGSCRFFLVQLFVEYIRVTTLNVIKILDKNILSKHKDMETTEIKLLDAMRF